MTPFYRRLFLNKPKHHAGAHIIASVKPTVTRDKKTKKVTWKEIDAELTIGDCRRVVTLEFSAYGKDYNRDLKNALYKAHTMLHVVTDFVAALEEAIEEIEEAS